jgi:hypothetical protein
MSEPASARAAPPAEQGDARAFVPSHDRGNPSMFLALATDPMVLAGDHARELAVKDLQRRSRRILLPVVRPLSLVLVFLIRLLKWALPFQFSWHNGIDVLCLWFVRRFMSADACELLVRHFVVETNLLRFIARNTGVGIEEPALKPVRLGDMGNRTVLVHDINVYNLVIDVGLKGADVTQKRAALDFSMLDMPAIDVERERVRLLELDIETCLYLMNIPFSLFTTEPEYERAVNSFQLDESVLGMLAGMTGDATFRTWTPNKFSMWVSVARDVPKELYLHASVCEYAHTYLRRLGGAGQGGARVDERAPRDASVMAA